MHLTKFIFLRRFKWIPTLRTPCAVTVAFAKAPITAVIWIVSNIIADLAGIRNIHLMACATISQSCATAEVALILDLIMRRQLK